jgi:LysR family transcriptional regulator, flagellar master operon regulator
MDTTLLKTFLEVAKTRHFGKAAEGLFVTQSAVSARIKLLESQLGVDLFVRQRNDIQLTPAGMRLIKHAETIVNGWQRARHEVALGEKGVDSIALGCQFDLWGILLREWTATMRNRSPDLVMQIEVQPADALINRLVNGLLDMALLFEPPQIAGLEIRQVAEIPLVLISSMPDIDVESCMHHNYYMVDWGTLFTRQHAGHFPDIAPPVVRMASGMLALDLMLQNGGSAYMAQPMVQTALDEKRLFQVEQAPMIERSAFAIYRPQDASKATLRSALAVMKELGQNRSIGNFC